MSSSPSLVTSQELPSRNEFDEDGYLQLHPDVSEAVYAGIVGSAWQHYTLHGFGEGRQWVKKANRTDGLSQEIAPGDLMYCDDAAHYYDVGESALHCIQTALFASRRSRSSVRSILDLPCGYGRVMRYLRKAFSEAQITGCDLDTDGIDFCARTFGAVPVKSHPEPERVSIEGKFDLIWCGSLLTHLSEAKCVRFMRLFQGLLNPSGILVFTTHGRRCEEELVTGRNRCGLSEPQIAEVLEGYRKTGFGFVEYSSQPGYGISLVSPSRAIESFVQRQEWQLLSFHENAWDKRQDVVVVQKAMRPMDPARPRS